MRRANIHICMNDFDWNQMRAFLATAESGSLSAAARRLGLTQPTLSRQVAALEAHLGVTLFERVGKALVLTETGHDLLQQARIMGSAAQSLGLAAAGHTQSVEGSVSISASDGVAAWLLPPVILALRSRAPGIRLDIVVSNSLSDLRRREADIAIRHVRPQEPDLYARLVREATASFYASHDWIARNGHPRSAADAADAQFIGFDRDMRFLDYLQGMGFPIGAEHCPVTCENSVASLALVRAGIGIGTMMDDVARQDAGLVRVLDDVPPITFPIWLVTHRELKTGRRFRIVLDGLAEGLAAP